MQGHRLLLPWWSICEVLFFCDDVSLLMYCFGGFGHIAIAKGKKNELDKSKKHCAAQRAS